MLRTLLLTTTTAGLLWALSGYDAEAARCRAGKLYRPSMGVCVSKTSHAGRPYAYHRRAYRVRHVRRNAPPAPKSTAIAHESPTAYTMDGIEAALSPYGGLVNFMPEKQQ